MVLAVTLPEIVFALAVLAALLFLGIIGKRQYDLAKTAFCLDAKDKAVKFYGLWQQTVPENWPNGDPILRKAAKDWGDTWNEECKGPNDAALPVPGPREGE